MATQNFKEVEVRFLEVDVNDLFKKLKDLGAEDHDETLLQEIIFSNSANSWPSENKMVRVRANGNKVQVAYKHHQNQKTQVSDVTEIEIEVDDFDRARALLEAAGLVAARVQQKKRHSFKLNEFTFDFDSWPSMPTYLEIEGPNEAAIKKMATKLGLDWSKVVFEDAANVILHYYQIPVKTLKFFTFDRIE